jgi:hypothetical protein
MGRHTALDGSAVHPLVAQGLARRSAAPVSARRAAEPLRDEGGLGWPQPEVPGGGGLGWPGDLDDQVRSGHRGNETETRVEEPPTARVPAGRRRSWRRLFGMSPAA